MLIVFWWKLRVLRVLVAAWGAVVGSAVPHMMWKKHSAHDRRDWFYKHSKRDNVCKDSWNLHKACFQTTISQTNLFCLASRKLWINWKSTKPKTLSPPAKPSRWNPLQRHPKAAPCIPVFHHSRTQHPLNTWRWRVVWILHDTSGKIPNWWIPISKIHASVATSHLHVVESACEFIRKFNQKILSHLSGVTIRRLCGLPVVLASVGRVMRIRRWSQPRWEVTRAGCFVSCHH